MYEKLDRSGDGVLGYRVSDRITEEELEAILQELETTVAERGDVDLLVHVESFPTPDLDALDEDIGFWLEHGDDIGRYAVVGDSSIMKWATKAGDKAADADVQYFETEALDHAWDWVRAN
jgi:hypothetical protein